MLFKLARESLWSRRGTATLCVVSIAISVFVLLSVEFVRSEARNAFGRTLSQADLVVGARTGQLNLLLYSIFRLGEPTNNIRWESYRAIADDPSVAWTIPLSLGDSHRGFRVLGTTGAYFEHYRYGGDRGLAFAQGRPFKSSTEAVMGGRAARKLGYAPGKEIILTHGTGGVGFVQHDNHPFTITGVLEMTGTPVDDTVHVSLEAIDLIHEGFNASRAAEASSSRTITAFIVGLKSRMLAFRVQRQINEFEAEPLQAILPGVALSQLWRVLGTVETVLRLIAVLVLVSALLGMSTMLLASLRERRGEIAVLRTIGASPLFIFLLVQMEALALAVSGLGLGMAALATVTLASREWLREAFGLLLPAYVPGLSGLYLAAAVIGLGVICAVLPAIGAYRFALGKAIAAR